MTDPTKGDPRAKPVVWDGGPWRGIPEAEWVAKIIRLSTPVRELGPDGEFRGWIEPQKRGAV